MDTAWMNLAWVLLGVAGLYYGAELLVLGGVGIARKLGVSPLVIGLTLVAFATSAPELVVSLCAAAEGNADVSFGNVVGSNVCNIALILGISALIRPLTVRKDVFQLDCPAMLCAAALLTLFYFQAHGLSRLQGGVLFAAFIVYTILLFRKARKEGGAGTPEEMPAKTLKLPAALLLTLLGGGMLVASAKAFLVGVLWFAHRLGVPDAVCGLTVVAVGTSLPELATSAVAAFKGENEIAIGNVIGSNIFNVLVILGLTALIRPMAGANLNAVDLGCMMLCTLLLLPIMRTGWRISRGEGALLLAVYAVYVGYLAVHAG